MTLPLACLIGAGESIAALPFGDLALADSYSEVGLRTSKSASCRKISSR